MNSTTATHIGWKGHRPELPAVLALVFALSVPLEAPLLASKNIARISAPSPIAEKYANAFLKRKGALDDMTVLWTGQDFILFRTKVGPDRPAVTISDQKNHVIISDHGTKLKSIKDEFGEGPRDLIRIDDLGSHYVVEGDRGNKKIIDKKNVRDHSLEFDSYLSRGPLYLLSHIDDLGRRRYRQFVDKADVSKRSPTFSDGRIRYLDSHILIPKRKGLKLIISRDNVSKSTHDWYKEIRDERKRRGVFVVSEGKDHERHDIDPETLEDLGPSNASRQPRSSMGGTVAIEGK